MCNGAKSLLNSSLIEELFFSLGISRTFKLSILFHLSGRVQKNYISYISFLRGAYFGRINEINLIRCLFIYTKKQNSIFQIFGKFSCLYLTESTAGEQILKDLFKNQHSVDLFLAVASMKFR